MIAWKACSRSYIKERLINSGRADMIFKITKCKVQISGNSRTIAKIFNAVVGDFGLIDADHELIRGSLSKSRLNTPENGKANQIVVSGLPLSVVNFDVQVIIVPYV